MHICEHICIYEPEGADPPTPHEGHDSFYKGAALPPCGCGWAGGVLKPKAYITIAEPAADATTRPPTDEMHDVHMCVRSFCEWRLCGWFVQQKAGRRSRSRAPGKPSPLTLHPIEFFKIYFHRGMAPRVGGRENFSHHLGLCVELN